VRSFVLQISFRPPVEAVAAASFPDITFWSIAVRRVVARCSRSWRKDLAGLFVVVALRGRLGVGFVGEDVSIQDTSSRLFTDLRCVSRRGETALSIVVCLRGLG
jgi:hypothetical protein